MRLYPILSRDAISEHESHRSTGARTRHFWKRRSALFSIYSSHALLVRALLAGACSNDGRDKPTNDWQEKDAPWHARRRRQAAHSQALALSSRTLTTQLSASLAIARSIARSLGRSLACMTDRYLARSLDRSLARSLASRSLQVLLPRAHARTTSPPAPASHSLSSTKLDQATQSTSQP